MTKMYALEIYTYIHNNTHVQNMKGGTILKEYSETSEQISQKGMASHIM